MQSSLVGCHSPTSLLADLVNPSTPAYPPVQVVHKVLEHATAGGLAGGEGSPLRPVSRKVSIDIHLDGPGSGERASVHRAATCCFGSCWGNAAVEPPASHLHFSSRSESGLCRCHRTCR